MPDHETSGGTGLLCVVDLLLVGACFYGAAALDFNSDPSLYFVYEGGILRVALAAVTVILSLYFAQLYAEVRVISRIYLLEKLCQVFGIVLIAQSLITYAAESWGLPKWLMIYGTVFSLAAIFSWRMVYSRTLLTVIGRQRLVFVGNNKTVQEISNEIAQRPGGGFQVLGFSHGAPVSSLGDLVRGARPDRVVVGMEERRNVMPISELLRLRFSGIRIEEAARTFESLLLRVSSKDLNATQLIFSRELNPGTNNVLWQRLLDILFSATLLLLLSPGMLLAMLALRLRSKEPALVRYMRVGKNGVPFSMLRFRRSQGLGFLFSRLHLDAAPELINVLRGEMSLVGPHAESPEAAHEHMREIPFYDYRLNVQPGMTGWAQVKMSRQERRENPLLALEFDLYYIKHLSPGLSIYILMTTLKDRLVWAYRN